MKKKIWLIFCLSIILLSIIVVGSDSIKSQSKLGNLTIKNFQTDFVITKQTGNESNYDVLINKTSQQICLMNKITSKCSDNKECLENELCTDNKCQVLQCKEGEIIKDRKCISCEKDCFTKCISNKECLSNEFCDKDKCSLLICKEGEIAKEHVCNPIKESVVFSIKNSLASVKEQVTSTKVADSYCLNYAGKLIKNDYIQVGTSTLIITYEDIKIAEYATSFANLNISIEKNVSGTWYGVANASFESINDSYKLKAFDPSCLGVCQYRWKIISDVPIYSDGTKPYISRDISNIFDYFGNTRTQEHHVFDFNNDCKRQFECSSRLVNESYWINYTTKGWKNVYRRFCNVSANCSFNYSKNNLTYTMTNTFYSDGNIDPVISLTSAQVLESGILTNNVTIESNFSHLSIDSSIAPYNNLTTYFSFDINSYPNFFDYTNNHCDIFCANSEAIEGYCDDPICDETYCEFSGCDTTDYCDMPIYDCQNSEDECTIYCGGIWSGSCDVSCGDSSEMCGNCDGSWYACSDNSTFCSGTCGGTWGCSSTWHPAIPELDCPVYNLTGAYGSSYSFNGVDESLDINYSSVSSISTSANPLISVSAWINVPSTIAGRANCYFGLYGTENGHTLALCIGSTNDFFSGGVAGDRIWISNAGSSYDWNSRLNIVPNTWNHIVYVSNGTRQIIYLNGAYGNSTANSVTLDGDTEKNLIGNYKEFEGNNFWFKGSVDELMIFNTSLTSAQISAIYNNQSNRFKSQGTQTLRQVNISSGYNQVNVTLNGYRRLFGTNLSARIGEWDITKGYNNSDLNSSANGLIGYWHFDSNNGTVNYTPDSSGKGNNGRCYNMGSECNFTKGFYNNSVYFDGNNDYVNVSNGIDINYPITISAWINSNDLSNSNSIIMPQTCGGYGFRTDSGKLSFDHICGGNGEIGDTTLSENIWYHAVAVYDGSNVDIYLNGLQDGSSSFSESFSTGVVYKIGADGGLTAEFKGSIDEVMIFNRTLTSDEVKELYTRGRILWNYTSWQNITAVNSGDNSSSNIFSISTSATNLLPEIGFASNAYNFYTSNLFSSMTLNTLDTIYPLISYGNGTNVNFANISKNFVYINTTWTELNFKNITFTLKNSTWSNATTYTAAIYLINFTNIANGKYWYYVNITDTSNNKNSTSIYNITLDITPPNATLLTPSGTITYSNPINSNFSIDLTPHYYYNSKEIVYYSEDQPFDGISFELRIDTQNKIENIKVYDAEPNNFRDNFELINNSANGIEIIGKSNIMSVNSFLGDNQTFFIGVSGVNLNSETIRAEYIYTIKFNKNIITLKSIGNTIFKNNYWIGLIILVLVILLLIFLIWRNRKRK